MSKFSILVLVSWFSVGCGGASGSVQAPSQPGSPSSAQPASSSNEERPTLTAQACEASGGSVVGDIGDGAIHRPEYRCANGAKPSGSIGAVEGGPMPIEGSVCCPH